MSEHKYLSGRSAVNIAESIETAVSRGQLAGGALLPPVRRVAADLRVSPATVAAAYRALQQRGLVVADGRRGTRIRPAAPVATPPPPPLPPGVRDLSDGNPDLALLPSLRRRIEYEPQLYRDELNDPELLAMARDAFAKDGVPADHVGVVGGALDGIERVLREHLRPGDRVAVEDPGFIGVLDLLAALSLVPVPVSIDDDGPLPSSLRRAARSSRAFVATPRAQNPTGAAITLRRGRELREVLRRFPSLLVIEDDHAGAVAGAPYVSLVAHQTHWAVVRSVSKSLGPDLRLALLASDPVTLARVEGRQSLGSRWVSQVLQRIVVTLLSDPATLRLLARAERQYAARRRAVIDALAAHGIESHGRSGLNVWIPMSEESRVVPSLLAKGWAVQPGERYRISSGPAIRITVATLAEHDARRLARDLAAIVAPARSPARPNV